MSRTKPVAVRFYFDADVLGLAHLVAALRSDATYPGDPGAVVKRRERPACLIANPATKDDLWIPQVASLGWLIITAREVYVVVDPASGKVGVTQAGPPTVTGIADRAPNASGWYAAPVTVSWTSKASSDLAAPASTPGPTVLSLSGRAQSATSAAACDHFGNCATGTYGPVNIDLDVPQVALAVQPTAPNGRNGWYTSPPSVQASCTDALSGIATCAQPVTVPDGTAQRVSLTATDLAGNAASATTRALNVDTHGPVLSVSGGAAEATYVLGQVPVASCTATDAVSGVDGSCTGSVSGGTTNGVRSFPYTARAADLAGNVTAQTITYDVVYAWNGFAQPVNDTAHQVGSATSVFKAGRTVPLRFSLANAQGQVVVPTTAPIWVMPAQGGAMSTPVNEQVYSDAADSGQVYRATGSTWNYNWSTKGLGSAWWRVGVRLDDCTTHDVTVGLQ